jgi:hypothetical protein
MENKWITKDGRALCPINDMSADHCKNSLKLLLRTKNANRLLYYVICGYNKVKADVQSKIKYDDKFSEHTANKSIIDEYQLNAF